MQSVTHADLSLNKKYVLNCSLRCPLPSHRSEKVEIPESTAQKIKAAEQRITWTINHPHMSGWLKEALRTALDQDPVAALNDLEILKDLINLWGDALIELMHRQ